MAESNEIRPFRIDVQQVDLDDMMERVARTRWANELPLDTGGSQIGLGWLATSKTPSASRA